MRDSYYENNQQRIQTEMGMNRDSENKNERKIFFRFIHSHKKRKKFIAKMFITTMHYI